MSRARTLRRGLTDGEVVSKILMQSRRDSVIVLVEGSKDASAFVTLLKVPPCSVVNGTGKRSVLAIGEKVANSGKRTLIAVVDADEQCLEKGPSGDYGCEVFFTDLRDLEAMQFVSPAGNRLVYQLIRHEEVERLSRPGVSLRDHIVHQLSVTGALRTVNARENLNIDFDSFELTRYVQPRDVRIDQARYLRDLSRAQRSMDPSRVIALATALQQQTPAELLLHGHDLSEFLAAIASGPHGYGSDRHSAENIELALRTGYSIDDFRTTRLFARLLDWGKRRQVDLLAS